MARVETRFQRPSIRKRPFGRAGAHWKGNCEKEHEDHTFGRATQGLPPNVYTKFVRGAGGWGGDRAPSSVDVGPLVDALHAMHTSADTDQPPFVASRTISQIVPLREYRRRYGTKKETFGKDDVW